MMNGPEELRAMRRELDELLSRAARLSERLAAHEKALASEMPAHMEPQQTTKPHAVPPPLPTSARVATQTPSREMPISKPPVEHAAPGTSVPSVAAYVRNEAHKQFDAIKSATAGEAPPAQRAPRANLEERVAKYWMPRIAILLVAVAIVWALTYYGRQSPGLRIAGGYAICAVLLFGAWRLEKKYVDYARVLFAGGVAASYFVTFATHYVPFSRIFETPAITQALLAGVVLIWAALAQIRQSRIIAVLVTFLGHLTIFLFLKDRGDIAVSGLASLVLISAGSAFFLLRNGWYYVAFIGVFGTYINHGVWQVMSGAPETHTALTAILAFLSVYFLLFAIAELASPTARERVPKLLRNLFVTSNSGLFFALGTVAVFAYEPARARFELFCLGYAVIALVFGLLYLRFRTQDPLYNAYFTKAIAAVTLGLAVKYDSDTLTAALAIQTVVLLVSSRRSGLVVTRILAFIVAGLTFVYGLVTADMLSSITYADPRFPGVITRMAITVAAFFGASYLYQRTDWQRRSPAWEGAPDSWLGFVWALDASSRPPSYASELKRPLNGLLFPYAYALAGAVLLSAFATTCLAREHILLVIAACALALGIKAMLLTSKPFDAASLLLTAIAAFVATVQVAEETIQIPQSAASVPMLYYALAAASLLAAALLSERQFFTNRDGLSLRQSLLGPYYTYFAAGFVIGLVIVAKAEGHDASIGLFIAATGALALMPVLHPLALTYSAVGLMLWGQLLWLGEWSPEVTTFWRVTAAVAIGLPLGFDRVLALFRARINRNPVVHVLAPASWLVAMRYAAVETPEGWLPAAWCVVGFAYLAYAGMFRSLVAGVVAIIGVVIATLFQVLDAYFGHATTAVSLATGFSMLTLFWIMAERAATFAKKRSVARFAAFSPEPLCVGIATTLAAMMLERLPVIGDRYLTLSWALLAVACFGLFLLLRQRYYRYAGLTVFALAIVRAGIDSWDLEVPYRIAAYIGLAALLLLVSFGYFKAAERARSKNSKPNSPTDNTPPAVPPPH